ncbi:hypothetical protein WAE56_13105 [Iodobacter sp. LRB]|uniref:hypothetical protein n=1 Tax=unclassified Iodobacter TaxID=235634 RepID=UPI000C11DD13|nr:hypothetical protein [Iodobacter sp. BJB302]PHV02099.1 hypothetical protein CSQ88_08715 [Iodobacter sp. BJB302]
MNRPLLLATLLAIFTAALHAFGGTLQIEGPLLHSNMPQEVSLMLFACWHFVTVALTLTAIALGLAARKPNTKSMATVTLISCLWLSFGTIFILIDVLYAGPHMLLQLPQWILLLPVGLLGLWGVSKANHQQRTPLPTNI